MAYNNKETAQKQFSNQNGQTRPEREMLPIRVIDCDK